MKFGTNILYINSLCLFVYIYIGQSCSQHLKDCISRAIALKYPSITHIIEPMNVKLAVDVRALLSFSDLRESLPTFLQ
jgi:hypothetical protein